MHRKFQIIQKFCYWYIMVWFTVKKGEQKRMLKKDSRYFPLSAQVEPSQVNISSNVIYNPLDLKFLNDMVIGNFFKWQNIN